MKIQLKLGHEPVFAFSNYNAVDTASAIAIALMTFGTMYPMSVYSGKVLLQVRLTPLINTPLTHIWYLCAYHNLSCVQTTPSHVIGQLDKLLREVRRNKDSSRTQVL